MPLKMFMEKFLDILKKLNQIFLYDKKEPCLWSLMKQA